MQNFFAVLIINMTLYTFLNALRIENANLRNFKATVARTFLPGLLVSLLNPSELLARTDFTTYQNDYFHTQISYPKSWEQKQGLLSNERNIVAFVDPNDPDTSVSIAFNPIPADFSRLTSFGTKDTLRMNLLPNGDGIFTQVLSESVKGESYFLEYVVSAPDAPTRHIQSIFALRPQELVVGVIAQTKEDSFDKHKDELADIIPSFHLNLE